MMMRIRGALGALLAVAEEKIDLLEQLFF